MWPSTAAAHQLLVMFLRSALIVKCMSYLLHEISKHSSFYSVLKQLLGILAACLSGHSLKNKKSKNNRYGCLFVPYALICCHMIDWSCHCVGVPDEVGGKFEFYRNRPKQTGR